MVSGDDVKRARGRLHLTQTQLANMLGVSRRTIAEWETSDELSATIVGRLSGVFTDAGQAAPDTPPLATVSDLELVTEMGRRLASLRSQLDGAALSQPGAPAPRQDETTQTRQHPDKPALPSAQDDGYPADADAAGAVGTEINDNAHGSPRFTDRHPGAC